MGTVVAQEKLYNAIESQNTKEVLEIIKQYPELLNTNITNDCLSTPLGRASWRGRLDIVQALVELGADVNFSGPTGIYPLMWAAKRDYIAVVKFLIDRGANIQLKSPEGFSALDYAIIHGNYYCATFLYGQDKSTDIIKQSGFYKAYAEKKNLTWIEYVSFLECVQQNASFEHCPDFYTQPLPAKLKDPVIDPRETWKDFFKRILEFEEPPMVQRNELPPELQPQNRFLGQFRAYINGMNPYASAPVANSQNKGEINLQLKQEDKQNFQKKYKNGDEEDKVCELIPPSDSQREDKNQSIDNSNYNFKSLEDDSKQYQGNNTDQIIVKIESNSN